MPPKKGKTKTKQPRLSEEDEDNSEFLDVQYNPDFVASLLEDLKIQIEAKCNQIQKDADFMVTSIQQSFHLELIKLPTQVKKMTLAKFKEEYGANIDLLTVSKSKPVNAQLFESAVKPKMQQSVFETPMINRSQLIPQTPGTRNPREGEVIVSTNGSPLGQFSTVVKPKNTNSIVPATPGVFVPLNNGDVVDLDELDLDTLSADNKKETLEKLQFMMNKLAQKIGSNRFEEYASV